MRKGNDKREPRTRVVEVKRKGGPTVFSLGMELFFAVAVNLARRYITSWSSQLLATVKESRIEKTEESRSRPHSALTDALGKAPVEPEAYYKKIFKRS